LGHAAHDALAGGGASIEAGQGQVDTRCIDALQAPEVERRDPLAVVLARVLDAWGVARAGVERCFLRGKPRRWSTRHIVATLTRTPRAPATWAQRSSQVISG
jgi:hypothetical protein